MKKSTFNFALFLLMVSTYLGSFAQVDKAKNESLKLIPYPTHLEVQQGSFIITAKTTIGLPTNGQFKNEALFLNQLLAKGLGHTLPILSQNSNYQIKLVYNAALTNPEAYTLQIQPQEIVITAKDGIGMFHAIETIRQLLPLSVENNIISKQLSLPALRIEDSPSYSWRGMHLDVSRHFYAINYIKKFIDLLALYKMNKLHLHLTDDQGWRIEIKKYPKLTEEGAWRTFNNQDSTCMELAKTNSDYAIDKEHIYTKNGKTIYGGYYTQTQMKGLVAYAASKHIDIIPEIDMPGHMMAAINSYPFLTCNGENKWGKDFSSPICPCNESTFEFAENVFSEIMDIFPSKYIHIGGDEVERTTWGQSEACKALMQKEGIKDLPALQSYFIHRMEKFFNSKGRKLIGWDEILEGGISPTAIIMYWRTWAEKAPYEAAKNGNTVIMTPGDPLYFDHAPDQNSIYNVYHFNPIPKGLNSDEAKAIIGAQANIWTEYIPSTKRAEYMYMPRMTALAELLWTNKTSEYDSYLKRLTAQYPLMDALKLNYRLPDIPELLKNKVFITTASLVAHPPLKGFKIRYTTDGSMPTLNSTELHDSLSVNQTTTFKIALFAPNGRRGDIYNIEYQKQTYAEAIQSNSTATGLKASYYKATIDNTKKMQGLTVDSSFTTPTITIPSTIKTPTFALRYQGYINVPQDDIYTFYLSSDDGSTLTIADRKVVDNDGNHSEIEKIGQVALKKGLHSFLLNFFNGGGGFALKLKYSINNSAPQDVPENWFCH